MLAITISDQVEPIQLMLTQEQQMHLELDIIMVAQQLGPQILIRLVTHLAETLLHYQVQEL